MTTPDEIRAAFEEWWEAHLERVGSEDSWPLPFARACAKPAYLAAAQRFGMTEAEREFLEAAYTYIERIKSGLTEGPAWYAVDSAYQALGQEQALRAEREPDHLAEALRIVDDTGPAFLSATTQSALRHHIQAAMEARDK